MAGQEGLDGLDDLLLLTARQLAQGGDHLPEPAGSLGSTPGPGLAEHLRHAHAQDRGELGQQLGLGDAARLLPVDDVGVVEVQPAGQLAHGRVWGGPGPPAREHERGGPHGAAVRGHALPRPGDGGVHHARPAGHGGRAEPVRLRQRQPLDPL